MQQAYVKEHSNSASNTVKLEQFRTMMMGIVKQAVEENNQSLGKEVSLQVGDKVLGKYEIAADTCIDCGTCAGACPTGAIEQG